MAGSRTLPESGGQPHLWSHAKSLRNAQDSLASSNRSLAEGSSASCSRYGGAAVVGADLRVKQLELLHVNWLIPANFTCPFCANLDERGESAAGLNMKIAHRTAAALET